MLTPPADLDEDTLRAALARDRGIAAVALTYRPVGWGSHHWQVEAADGVRWFVTVDELDRLTRTAAESTDQAYHRLRASLRAVTALHAAGATWAVAPHPGRDGEPVGRIDDRLAVTVHPFVEGESYRFGAYPDPVHRGAILRHLVDLHRAPAAIRDRAEVDDFGLDHRDALEAALVDPVGPPVGPAATAAAELFTTYARAVRDQLDRYDALAARIGTDPTRRVLTHGEPHPGNTMRTAAGWCLIDWNTALVAPPERDLWRLDPGGDEAVLRAYTDATGTTPDPAGLEFYGLRWNLADLAVAAGRFRTPHTGTEDDTATLDLLRIQLAGLG